MNTSQVHKRLLYILGCVLLVLIAGTVYAFSVMHSRQSAVTNTTGGAQPSTNTTSRVQTEVTWNLDKGQVWVASSTPPACDEAPIFTMPVELHLVTAILYPGQVRGNAYKPHGGFRFSDQTPDNKVTVKVPLDATITRGSRAFRNGENQFYFEFVNSCGIWYSMGHLLELTPKFQEIAAKLPLIDDDKDGFHTTQIYDVDSPVPVKKGEVLATAVGYAKQHNVFFDWGVLDLRQKNGFTISPEWAQAYGKEFDQYAVCGFEMLPPADTAYLKGLHSGTVESGTKSDYCH